MMRTNGTILFATLLVACVTFVATGCHESTLSEDSSTRLRVLNRHASIAEEFEQLPDRQAFKRLEIVEISVQEISDDAGDSSAVQFTVTFEQNMPAMAVSPVLTVGTRQIRRYEPRDSDRVFRFVADRLEELPPEGRIGAQWGPRERKRPVFDTGILFVRSNVSLARAEGRLSPERGN